MSRLSDNGFSNHSKATTYVPSRTTSGGSTPPDRDRCPRGWDTDIWHLALVFESLAGDQDIKLRAGRPVIYSELAGRIKDSGIRNWQKDDLPFSSEQLEATLAQEFYSDIKLFGPLWRQFIEAMICEFFTRHWDENATATFTGKDMFIDIWDIVVRAVDSQTES
jgi:hypothetical protein